MKFRITFLLLLAGWQCHAQQIDYQQYDSLKVMELIQKGYQQDPSTNMIVYYARQLKGIPYVGKTLERNDREKLVVNLRELDCTTYVENVMALYLCHKNQRKRFEDFCTYLRLIRYENGKVDYTKRLHYFTYWIQDNTRMGFVQPISTPDPPFSAVQTVKTSFMTAHPELYPMIKTKHTLHAIAKMEKKTTGQKHAYIPTALLNNNTSLRDFVRDGDIIGLVTTNEGLDISHVGFAVWSKDGLHLLNASSIKREVIEDPQTMFDYLKNRPKQAGIRIIRPN